MKNRRFFRGAGAREEGYAKNDVALLDDAADSGASSVPDG